MNLCCFYCFLSLLATARRLFAIAWGFTTSRADSHYSYLCVYSYAHYFLIRRNAALLRWTECEAADFCMAFYFANITVTEIDLDNAIWNIDFKIRCSNTRATFVKAFIRHGVLLITPWHPTASQCTLRHKIISLYLLTDCWNYTRVLVLCIQICFCDSLRH